MCQHFLGFPFNCFRGLMNQSYLETIDILKSQILNKSFLTIDFCLMILNDDGIVNFCSICQA